MPTSAFTKFEALSEHLAEQVHKFDTHTLKVYLSNTAPDVVNDAVKADLAEIAGGNGYTAGGQDTANTTSRAAGVTSVIGTDVSWTASGGNIGPFQYAVLYNDDPSSPADPLIGYWNYGAALTVNDGETFSTDFGSSMFTIT
jgi:hypothetical protein